VRCAGAGEYRYDPGPDKAPDAWLYTNACAMKSKCVRIAGTASETWTATGPQFSMALLQNDPSQANGVVDPNQMGRISLAACASNLNVMYAVVALPGPKDFHMYRILHSDSAEAAWRPVRNLGHRLVRSLDRILAPDTPDQTDPVTPDMAGTTGWYTNCIAVDSHNPGLAGIG
jgi:hypothetical protein